MSEIKNYSDDIEYARRRLQDTVVLTEDNRLVRVDSILNSANTFVCGVVDVAKDVAFSINIKDLNLTPVKLGFISPKKDSSYFCTRRPTRKPVQGLSLSNINFYRRINVSFDWKFILRPVFNTYPSWEQAIKNLSGDVGVAAFSREFALEKEVDSPHTKLLYRDYHVGSLINGTIELHPQKMFLKECLEEAMAC